jgi:steroid 5-alpha reductase family enzyme
VPPRRFLTTGLWRWSRHPNFFFEQAQWWVVFLFGALAAGSLLQWTVLGAALLTGLFVGSTIFTESITRSKYPEYAEYQASTSPIIPWFPRRAVKGAEPAKA